MANGNLGKLVTTGGSYQTLMTVPLSGVQFTTCFIYALNPTGGVASIKIAITNNTTPAQHDHVQGELPLEAGGGSYELPAMICHPGEKIMVYSDVPGVTFSVRGIEQT